MKVLIADDNFNNRQLVADILDTMGYEAIMSHDGDETLRRVQTTRPDLIILDVDMPGMDGFKVCATLKTNPQTADIPILMLTALSDTDSRVRGLMLGADDYLTKPFSPRELVERVRTRLRSKSESDGLRQTQQLVRQTFERFVPPSVVERLLRDPSQLNLGGQLQEVTVMFSDLQNFSSIAEHTDPQALLTMLNQYHTMVVGGMQRYGGTIDKFIGDGVMALFNTPLSQPDHAQRAICAALHIRSLLPEFYQQFEPVHRMEINFGIHTGMAVIGNIGAPEIMNFTAVGDTVNLAARLQQMSMDGEILVSHATYEQAAERFVVDQMGSRIIRGRTSEAVVYKVVGLAG